MFYEYLVLFIFLFLLDQKIGRITLEFVLKRMDAFSKSEVPRNLFQRFIKKNQNKNFVKKIFIKPRIFGGFDVTIVSNGLKK